jgi:hypothetical protein
MTRLANRASLTSFRLLLPSLLVPKTPSLASKKGCRTATPSTLPIRPIALRRARRARAPLRPQKRKELSTPLGHRYNSDSLKPDFQMAVSAHYIFIAVSSFRRVPSYADYIIA